MENLWNEKEAPQLKVGVFTNVFSLNGRIGRETYGLRTLAFLLVIGVVMGIAGLFYGSVLAFLLSPVGKGMMVVLSSLMLTTYIQRAHDIGVGALMPVLVCLVFPVANFVFFTSEIVGVERGTGSSRFSSLVVLLATWYGYWLMLWPGERIGNQYGEPQRNRRSIPLSQWGQVKEEYFSFAGRLNRKWFILLSLLFGSILWNLLFLSGEKFRLLFGGVMGWQEIGSAIFQLILGVSGLVLFGSAYVTLVMRRVQDSRLYHFFGHLFILIYLLSLIGKAYLSLFGATEMSSLAQGVKIIFCVLAILLEFVSWVVLCSVPSQKGANEYGVNPVEEGLLPGERLDKSI